eukprot:CAMPEP_0172034226 /NCGR_PEP_ID=MMETSP1041-20130122/20896_1 /TAXON_ID=464988 /ORGANISM="Hemiselmis andersenii, Strain CCMP439" /LENGTH=82 /DNA_ID=CAMNT_0012691131 /DNA_START=7 /DNA_END=255 /DNA_ORIENTATION=-
MTALDEGSIFFMISSSSIACLCCIRSSCSWRRSITSSFSATLFLPNALASARRTLSLPMISSSSHPSQSVSMSAAFFLSSSS